MKFFLLLIGLSACQGGRIRLLGDGPVEFCDKKSAKDFIIDINLEFLVENDDAFVNGNLTFNAEMKEWKANFWTERKVGASWFRAPIQGSNVDYCKSLVDESDFFYPFLKDFPPCPFKKGVSLNLFCNKHFKVLLFIFSM